MRRPPEVLAPGAFTWGLLVRVFLLVIAFGVRHADAEPSSARTSLVSSLPSLGSASRVGDAPPVVTGRVKGEIGPRWLDMGEIRREMRKARGRVLFMHLWASWCGPCLEELPLMNRFARAARARGATVISVSLDNDARGVAGVPAVLRARAPGLTTFVARFQDPGQFMSIFSRSWEGSIPALFAFDRAGKLRASLVGELAPSELESLMAKMRTPPPSRRSSPRPR